MSEKGNTLNLTHVLSDPTRYSIYDYVIETNKPVTVKVKVKEIAEEMSTHPNVARLHLTKLVDVNLLDSYINQTNSNGRPSRLYVTSKTAIEISFPYRDYKLLSSITIEAIAKLWDAGKSVLFQIGKDYGVKMIRKLKEKKDDNEVSELEKTKLLTEASNFLGLHASFEYDETNEQIVYVVKN